MSADVSVLGRYHAGLVESLKAHFGDSLETVRAYLPDSTDSLSAGLQINTPAALVEITRLGLEDDQGDGRDALRCEVAIHCVLGGQTPNLQLELRNFAAEVMRVINNHRAWAVCLCGDIAQAEDIDALPGTWKQGQGGYDSFVVTFTQTVFMGEEYWKFNGAAPVQTVHYAPLGMLPEQVA